MNNIKRAARRGGFHVGIPIINRIAFCPKGVYAKAVSGGPAGGRSPPAIRRKGSALMWNIRGYSGKFAMRILRDETLL